MANSVKIAYEKYETKWLQSISLLHSCSLLEGKLHVDTNNGLAPGSLKQLGKDEKIGM